MCMLKTPAIGGLTPGPDEPLFPSMDCVSVPEFTGKGTVQSYDEVVNLLSSRKYDGTSQYWWRVKATGHVLYGKFDVQSPSRELRLRILIFASESPSRAAELVGDTVLQTEWVDPMKPPFESPSNLLHIDRKELQPVELFTRTVEVVRYNGTHYVHKFMGYLSQPSSFASEIKNHQRVLGSSFVPKLHGIVTHHGANRGLLLEFVDGKNLSDLSSSINASERYHITSLILAAIEDFERRGYYPQDLKCANIVLRDRDRALFIVDLGEGFSEGMYLKDALRASGHGSILAEHMLYTLGRTVWELWIDDVPPEDQSEKPPDSLPPLICSLITGCCKGRFKTVQEVSDYYFEKLVASELGSQID